MGVDDKTVGVVRRDLEDGAEIPHHEIRVGKDGVSQPARKPIRTVVACNGAGPLLEYTTLLFTCLGDDKAPWQGWNVKRWQIQRLDKSVGDDNA